MKKIYLLLLCSVCLFFTKTEAQLSSYTFSQSSGTYTPISGGTVIATATNHTTSSDLSLDQGNYPATLPFTFTYNGIGYTALNVNANGYITFGTTLPVTSGATPISAATAYAGAISPMGRDLWGVYGTTGTRASGSVTVTGVTSFVGIAIGKPIRGTGIPAGATIAGFDIGAGTITLSAAATSAQTLAFIAWPTGEIRAEALGSSPNRIFVIQYSGFADWITSAPNNNNFDFQIRLSEANNSISFVYGSYSNINTTARDNQVGLRGATNTDFNNRTSSTDWSATTAGTANTSVVSRSNIIFPASGLTFSWTPNVSAVDYCNIQSPGAATIPFGGNVTVYTQGYEPGVTEPQGQQGAGITVWIATNTANTDPATWPTGSWTAATYNASGPANNNDEYMLAIGSTLNPGTYYYASRWLLAGGQYRYGAYSPGGGGFWDGTNNINGILTVTPPPAPANDDCGAATVLTPNTGVSCASPTAGNTLSATASAETAPTCGVAGVNDDVWYSFVASSTAHTVTLSGVSGATDMAMALYSGSCGALTQVTCSDPDIMIATGLTAGQTYLVRVWTISATVGTTASFNICVTTPLANDICAGAISLPVNGTCTPQTFSTQGATDNNETGDCTAGTETAVWFKFIATSTAATVTVTGSTGFDAVLGVLNNCGSSTAPTGGACVDATGDAGVEVRNLTGLTVGNTYYIQVYDYQADVLPTSTFDICVVAISCPTPTGVAAGSVTSTSASITWTGAGTNILEYGLTGFTPGTGATAGTGGTVINPATSPQIINSLTPSSVYQVYVRQDCTGAGNGFSSNSAVVSFTTLGAPPANDEASGALEIVVDAACTGSSFTSLNATSSANEPYPSCSGTKQTPVWFKFVAPVSGAVRVSTDITAGTLADTKMGLFSATNVNDYSTFSIISCDDDGGSAIGSGFYSVVYATGLTAGSTYYVAVDKYASGTANGTFCLTIEELSTSMLASANTCASTYQTPINNLNTTYTGWQPLVDATSKLIALVRNPAGGAVSGFTVAQNINAGAVRQSPSTGTYYLNRNYRIANTTATNVEVQFFFLASELAALNAADGTTLGSLAATRQVETVAGCQNNYVPANGAVSLLPQTSNGASADGLVNWIQVTTPAFSNFYLNNVGQVLPISIEYFRGTRQNTRNVLDWKVSCYNSPTVTLTLERSVDGRSFAGINTTTETATRCLQPFNYNDLAPLAGMNYYRLKSIDIDGKISYSTVVALLNKDKGFEMVSLAPNPVKDMAILSVTSAEKAIIEIMVTDVNGKQISRQRLSLIAGNNQLPLNFENVAAGTYQVTGLTADGQVRSLRFIKQ